MSFIASYNGTCAYQHCTTAIKPGDQVQYVADELMHMSCAMSEMFPKAVCPQCHLQHAGECF